MSAGKEREVFARTLRAVQPYAADVVLIGGWVHALYVAEAGAGRAVYTTDIDLTLPRELAPVGRATLLELLGVAGFQVQQLDPDGGELEIWHPGDRGGVIDLDLLTDAPDPLVPVEIVGQPGLVVHGYPDQHVLLENARWMEVGREIHDSLDPPVRIRVPTLGAYVLVKALSARRRPGPQKRAKDLVYLFEIIRHEEMRRQVRDQMPALAGRYPAEYHVWRTVMEETASNREVLAAVAEQLTDMSRLPGGTDTAGYVAVHLRRLLKETPTPFDSTR